jgi:hypothetical protein
VIFHPGSWFQSNEGNDKGVPASRRRYCQRQILGRIVARVGAFKDPLNNNKQTWGNSNASIGK